VSRARMSSLSTQGLCLILLLGAAAPHAQARNDEFHAVVREVESYYHVKRSSRFASWIAALTLNVTRPEGTQGFKVAIFEDEELTPGSNDDGFENAVERALGENWKPLVRVWSRRDGERSHIYTCVSGGNVQFLIISIERDEAVVMQLSMSQKRFARMLESPRDMDDTLLGKHSDGEEARRNSDMTPPLSRREATPTPVVPQ
jgi:hypothetical protein